MENYKKSIEDIFKETNSSDLGLTYKEANLRLEKYGKNILPKKKRDSILKLFIKEYLLLIHLLILKIDKQGQHQILFCNQSFPHFSYDKPLLHKPREHLK